MNRLHTFLPVIWLVSMLFRLVLGAVFVYAGIEKVMDPAAFALDLSNYRLLPGWMINPVAIALPWIEIFAGCSVLAGVFLPGGALIISTLLLLFATALGISLFRGLDISCGCFGSTAGQGITWWYLVRDIILFLMGCTVLLLSHHPHLSVDSIIRKIRGDSSR
ncbi:MAG TPA: MauE/DoxX family redox-associated membrane protein [Deltaproteobacteria bacterium]|nr:MauE/DoxX family redox-associated membrane protein [Deltaproteobacteria bacterium]